MAEQMTRPAFIRTGRNYNLCSGYKYPNYNETLFEEFRRKSL